MHFPDQASTVRLLIVDDDPVVLHTLQLGLTRAGYQVCVTKNPLDALSLYKSCPPDLSILDIGLPGLPGTELATQMLEYVYRPIIILSRHSELEHVRAAIGSGAVGYLVKPISAAQLIPSIETARARFGDLSQRLANRLGESKISATQMYALIDQLAFGLIVVDEHCNIIMQNQTAQSIFEQQSVLKNRSGKLVAARCADQRTLRQALINALRHATPEAGVLGLADHRTGRMISVLTSPLAPRGLCGQYVDYATVMIVNPDHYMPAPAHVLKTLYGLSNKECRLVQALLNGVTVEEFCATRYVTRNTARSQLKSIYRKTNTNRQVDLVRSLARLFDNINVAIANRNG